MKWELLLLMIVESFLPEFGFSAFAMASNGIKAYLFESLRPTPELFLLLDIIKQYQG